MSTMRVLAFVLIRLLAVSVVTVAAAVPRDTHAHGSVTPDADLCIIRIGFFKAHFKIYQPESRGHEDFCEDLPGAGNSIFIMEYEHDGLAEVPLDFRIIENVTNQGRFRNNAHVEAIGNLEPVTGFHHPAAIQPDVFAIAHDFEHAGEYVGIVTVARPDGVGNYTAVFPFEAGYTGLGYWPWIIGGLVLLQLNYLWMNGRIRIGRRLFPGQRGTIT